MNPVAVGIAVAIAVLALAGMLVSWRLRGRRQRGLASQPAPADTGRVVAEADGLHLSTTFADRPLDRVVAAGLGFRARAHLAVTDRGVRFARAGGDDLFVPADRLTGAGSASWTLDRGVERNGLFVLGWTLDDGDARVPVESSFRLDAGQDALTTAVLALTAPLRPTDDETRAPRGDHPL